MPRVNEKITNVRCCIAGGGPAGIMLGYLLARAGVSVAVLEKYHDFFRDFRGDTIHPSTMEIMKELGLLDAFLKLPHQKTVQMQGQIGDETVILADFSKLKTVCPFIAFMPQWDFLNFISDQAKRYPGFHLLMGTEATELLEEKGKVVGVKAKKGSDVFDIRAELVIGADGRHSTIREKSRLKVESLGAPMDVLWFRLPQKPGDPTSSLGRIDNGRMMVMIDRGDYWQCGFIIPKGEFEKIKADGLTAFQNVLVKLQPFLAGRVETLSDWEKIKLLSVAVDRMPVWYKPGLLCIGDAAHAMSPIGGVGINFAVQDAVAAANLLIHKFLSGGVALKDLQAVQRRREFPVRMMQRIQILIQNRVIRTVLARPTHPKLPWALKLFQKFPSLRRLPAYLIGIGIRPEHVKTLEAPLS